MQKNKIIFCGDGATGKTALINYIVYGMFTDIRMSTVAGQAYLKKEQVDGKEIQCALWDTAGQEIYRSLVSSYMRGAVGAFIVCSADIPDSIDSLQEWIDSVKGIEPGCIIVLIYNKNDLNKPETRDKFTTFAESNEYTQFITSAKTGEYVMEAFHGMCEKIVEENKNFQPINDNNNKNDNKTVDISSGDKKDDKNKKGCCN